MEIRILTQNRHNFGHNDFLTEISGRMLLISGGTKMVGAAGFEPTTPCSQGRYATRLRYAPTKVREAPYGASSRDGRPRANRDDIRH